LLTIDERCRRNTTWKTHRQSVPKAKQLVVPPFSNLDERQMSEVRMLLLEQVANERRLDVQIRWGVRTDRHSPPHHRTRADVGAALRVSHRAGYL